VASVEGGDVVWHHFHGNRVAGGAHGGGGSPDGGDGLRSVLRKETLPRWVLAGPMGQSVAGPVLTVERWIVRREEWAAVFRLGRMIEMNRK
jgi:hypothetical protein